MNYYNEYDAYAAEWIRNLIRAGLIPPGVVDERSIVDVKASDLRGFTQCHFFCGVAGWPYALQLAGWPVDRPVWTASLPCQPFSSAGTQKGLTDERHLWPVFAALVEELSPECLFGEQVSSKIAEPWLDNVQLDLERMGYAFGAIAFPSASIGAPHIRDRTYWMAYTNGPRSQAGLPTPARGYQGVSGEPDDGSSEYVGPDNGCTLGGLADAQDDRRVRGPCEIRREIERSLGLDLYECGEPGCVSCGVGDSPKQPRERRAGGISGKETAEHGAGVSVDGRLSIGLEHAGKGVGGLADTNGRDAGPEREQCSGEQRQLTEDGGIGIDHWPRPTNGFWGDADWLYCRDGKWRPVEPGTFPLVDGSTNRVGRLRAYGNAINPHQAKEFIECYLELDHTLDL